MIISLQRFEEKHHCLLYFIYTFFILFKWSVSCVPHLCQSFGQGWLFNNSVEKCILLSAVTPKVKQITYIYMNIYDFFLICGALNCSVLLKSKCVSPANENILLGLYVSLSKAKSVISHAWFSYTLSCFIARRGYIPPNVSHSCLHRWPAIHCTMQILTGKLADLTKRLFWICFFFIFFLEEWKVDWQYSYIMHLTCIRNCLAGCESGWGCFT